MSYDTAWVLATVDDVEFECLVEVGWPDFSTGWRGDFEILKFRRASNDKPGLEKTPHFQDRLFEAADDAYNRGDFL